MSEYNPPKNYSIRIKDSKKEIEVTNSLPTPKIIKKDNIYYITSIDNECFPVCFFNADTKEHIDMNGNNV